MVRTHRHVFSLVVVTSISCFASVSNAQDNSDDPFAPPEGQENESDSEGPEAGLRLGLTNVSGKFEPGVNLDDEVAGLLPLWLDAGYRFADRWFVGAYFQYAVGVVADTRGRECPSCVNTWKRYGLQGQYSLVRTPGAHIWLGLAVGRHTYDILNEEDQKGTAYDGWELLHFQLGSSWRPLPGFEVGPFMSVSYAMVDAKQNTCARKRTCGDSVDVDLPSGGGFFTSSAGLRVAFLP
jgi:hypothetical protein